MRDAELENDMLKYQQAKDKLRAIEEKKRIGAYRDQLVSKQKEGLANAEKIKHQEALTKQQHQEYARRQALDQMNQWRQEQQLEKDEKNQVSRDYKRDLLMQDNYKRQMNQKERDQDKLYALLEMAQLDKTEHSRKLFFDHMRNF